VKVVDDDLCWCFDDDYDDDFNEDDLLMVTNSYMKNDDDIDGVCMLKNVDVNEDDLLNERMHYWVICSCIHKCQVGYLYQRKTIRILCIQQATIGTTCM